MFLLRNLNDGNVFYLMNKTEFVVGRKDCDFLIQNDQSISRRHALIRIMNDNVMLEDCGAKYHTFHNGEELTPNIEVHLINGDEIQFGLVNSKYKLERHTFITTSTRLHCNQKAKLQNDLQILGGQYVENWTSTCTHLTVNEVTLTVKVLHALIDQKPMVSPAYWTKYVDHMKKSLPPPDIENYNKPPLMEAMLNDVEFTANPLRKTLFSGKIFLFLKDKSKSQMQEVIQKAGGTCVSWEKDHISLKDVCDSKKDYIVIQPTNSEEDTNFNKVIQRISNQGKRTIPLQEIAMSILRCSCEKDCNPQFNRVKQVFPTSHPKELTQHGALIRNTESVDLTAEPDVQMIIPDTFENCRSDELKNNKDFFLKQTTSVKRVSNEELKENPSKKTKFETLQSDGDRPKKEEKFDANSCKSVAGGKRKAEDDNGTIISTENKKDFVKNPFALNKKIKSELLPCSKKNPFNLFLHRESAPQTKESSTSSTSLNKNHPFGTLMRHNEDMSQISDEQKKKENAWESICNNETNQGKGIKLSKEMQGNVKVPGKRTLQGLDLKKHAKRDGEKEEEAVKNKTLSINEKENGKSSFFKQTKINCNKNDLWLSKKINMDEKGNVEEVEPKLQEYIDQFKDTVEIEIIANLSIRLRKSQKNEKQEEKKCVWGAKNFKCFKKMSPLKPQKIIIGINNFIATDLKDVPDNVDAKTAYEIDDETSKKNRFEHNFI